MPATRDTLAREPGTAARGRARPPTLARGGVPTSNAGTARLARDGGVARADLVGTAGNRIARSTLAVSHPHDPAEREAEALASRVAHGAAPPAALARTPGPAVARAGDDAPAPAADVAAGGTVEVSTAVSSLLASPGAGAPMDPAVQAKVEPHLGADLGAVRVHQGPEVGAAAAELHARAFTVGADIFLGEGESAADLELMAHEATHVVQQQAVAVYRDLEVTDLIPDWIIDGVTSAAQEIPGYTLLTVITGKDPLTDEPATVSRTEFVEKLLTFGPFGAAVGPLLQTIDVLGDIVTLLMDALAAHNLTLSRIGSDISSAWDEMGVLEGIDGNVAIVERYVDAIVADIRAFVSDVIDAVVAKVREVAADVAEPFLQRPEIAPYWNLATKVFHHDPLRDEDVSAPTVEILGDFLRLAGRDEVLAQMTERGTLQETADWLDQQWAVFTDLLSRTGALFADAWAAISPENLPNLIENITSLADRAFTLLQDVGAFASTILLKVLELVKKSLLGWASEHAHKVPGFHLLTVILERNPFTDEAVPRTAENLIKGFITLLPGGEAMYDELAESGVIGDAAATIESAMTRLNISWDLITGTFLGIWNTVTLESLLSPIETFDRIVAAFGDPLNRIAEFVGVVIQTVITLILQLMNFPSELLGNIIANATAAIDDIMNDPVGFLVNIVAAMKSGFEGFFGNIAGYLLEGLSGWLFRGLRGLGIEPPTSLSVENIITLVIQVLGVTTETLWTKLGERIGPERVEQIRGALDHLTGAWTFIKDVQERGITAVWEFIQGQLGNLWETVLTTARDWIMREIVERVVTRLLSMLDPTGVMAVINGTIAFFDAVQSAIDYFRELLEIVDGYVSTIASVARGDVAPGAAMLERGLASAVPVAIGFLANQVGLGNVPEKVQEIIVGLRELVDQALDWLFDQAMALGRAALDALTGGAPTDPAAPEPEPEPVAADGAIPTGLPPEEIKRRVLDLVEARMTAGDINDVSSLHAYLAATLNTNRPSGLTGLQVHVADATTMDVAIEASASPPELRRIRWDQIFSAESLDTDAELDELKAALSRASMASYAAVAVNGARIGELSSSGGGVHAEEGLVRSSTWTDAIAAARNRGPDGRSTVTLMINRTPCISCVTWLVEAINDARRQLGPDAAATTFVLAATGTYRRQARIPEEDLEYLKTACTAMAQRAGQTKAFKQIFEEQLEIWKQDLRSFSTEWSDEEIAESGLGQLAAATWQIAGLDAGGSLTPRRLEIAAISARLGEKLGWSS
ncbi:DUF4157 domain-containing protein [Cellulomonas sp. Leaf334]|uniref:eCIS core domain-containing protein n=1 Tax=Cellulomonas sp. Leaf334 TaxID=1736339 RepID=UPI0006FE380C|nr:DUF4157 domain-containing protein [Cellulomonas sp. Leaf334]KQR16295.1 hypothetical protein ASF78_02500 [Cellulomonas sp. Leaf334]